MIVPASLDDREAATQLIYETMGTFGDAALGLGDKALALRAVDYFFTKRGNRFSREVTWLSKQGDQATGVLVAFTGDQYLHKNLAIGLQLWNVYGFKGGTKLIWNSMVALNSQETKKDEFYISHIAVHPNYRRQGIAHELMAWAESLAKQSGLKKCSLVVDIDNSAAFALYQSLGYQVVETEETPKLEKEFHTRGHRRMVKNLAGGEKK
jgi:ribosomal protein S18 acetylase RimI-like enzyme